MLKVLTAVWQDLGEPLELARLKGEGGKAPIGAVSFMFSSSKRTPPVPPRLMFSRIFAMMVSTSIWVSKISNTLSVPFNMGRLSAYPVVLDLRPVAHFAQIARIASPRSLSS